ncbi:MAG: hypothetical protein LBM70_00835, partial [Victivallales bacterium]|nr:hypothetical protein [Victivallales bacterium]
MKQLTLLIATVVISLFFSGCVSTPFAPIAVPNNTAMRPESPVDTSLDQAILEALQHAAPAEYVIAPNDAFAIAVEGQPTMSRPRVIV